MTVRPVDADNRAVAARSLASAFATDPLFRWITRDRARLGVRLRHCFDALLAADARSDAPMSYAAGDAGAVAIWHGVDRWQSSTIESLRLVPAFARSFGVRLDRAIRVETASARAHPREPHYYLAYLGTHPNRQGDGLASSLLRDMTERCDREGIPAYLESSNPSNDGFYARHGFVVTNALDLPAGAPPVNAMWREPN